MPPSPKFPRCDAAVRKRDASEWDLADAIVAECSETGDDGARNESYAMMKAMQQEIAANHGVELSFERIRKLRKVASAFPPGRRRPAVSLEGHLEAGTPEALDAFITSAPKGTPLTRECIRRLKHPAEKAGQDQQKAERRHQTEDQQTALLNLCRQLEREREQREQRYTDLCRSMGKEPEPFSPPLSPEVEPSRSVAEDLEQGLRVLLMSHGFDPKADNMKRAIDEFVRAVLVQQE
jgi:ribosome-binding protein aMBF1 (putative translation factor)